MKRWTGVGLALALAALSGCTQSNQAQVRQDVKGMRQELSQTAQGVQAAAAEAALASKVKAAISVRKGLDARAIKVEVQGTDVTLKGDVSSPEQATIAEDVAKNTQGVSSVTNELTMRVPATSTPSAPSAATGNSSSTATPGAPPGGGTPSGNGY